jgi:hypothetical protein
VDSVPEGREFNHKKLIEMTKDNTTTNASNEAESPAFLVGAVISRFSFEEREPEIGAYVSLVWEDGSDCECTYDGLDKSILPLPTHWYYVG